MGGKMELILFRLFVFFSALILLISILYSIFNGYKAYEENKLYNSKVLVRAEKKSKPKPLCNKTVKQKGTLKSTLNDCENLIPIENTVRYAKGHMYRSEKYQGKAINGLAFGFGCSFLLMFTFYSFRWILTGRLKPIILVKI